MRDIRMWEFVPQEDGTVRLTGVVKGPPPGCRTHDCHVPVDHTIITSPMVVVHEKINLVITRNSAYRLVGLSRPHLILGAFATHPPTPHIGS